MGVDTGPHLADVSPFGFRFHDPEVQWASGQGARVRGTWRSKGLRQGMSVLGRYLPGTVGTVFDPYICSRLVPDGLWCNISTLVYFLHENQAEWGPPALVTRTVMTEG